MYITNALDRVTTIFSDIIAFLITEKEQQEAIEHIDEVQNEIDRWVNYPHTFKSALVPYDYNLSVFFAWFSPL